MASAFIIEDNVLAPKGAIIIDYNGPNPFRIYSKLRTILLTLMRAGGKDYFEPDFRWDTTGEPIGFFVRCHVTRKVDKWTKGTAYVRLQGKQPRDPTKPGWAQVELSCVLTTSYPTETFFQKAIIRPFLYVYHRLMYNDIRRGYVRIHRERMQKLENEVRAIFNLEQRPL